MIVHSDGKLAACCWDYNLGVSDGGFGDVNTAGLLETWRGPKRSDLAKRLVTSSLDDKPQKCRSCAFLYGLPTLPQADAQVSDHSLVQTSPYGHTYSFPRPAVS